MAKLLNKLLLIEKHPKNSELIQRLLNQAIELWQSSGDTLEFNKFMNEFQKYPQLMK